MELCFHFCFSKHISNTYAKFHFVTNSGSKVIEVNVRPVEKLKKRQI